MLSKDSAETCKSASSRRNAQDVLDPRSSIETSSGGSGTTNDPGGSDNKPPGYADSQA